MVSLVSYRLADLFISLTGSADLSIVWWKLCQHRYLIRCFDGWNRLGCRVKLSKHSVLTVGHTGLLVNGLLVKILSLTASIGAASQSSVQWSISFQRLFTDNAGEDYGKLYGRPWLRRRILLDLPIVMGDMVGNALSSFAHLKWGYEAIRDMIKDFISLPCIKRSASLQFH